MFPERDVHTTSGVCGLCSLSTRSSPNLASLQKSQHSCCSRNLTRPSRCRSVSASNGGFIGHSVVLHACLASPCTTRNMLLGSCISFDFARLEGNTRCHECLRSHSSSNKRDLHAQKASSPAVEPTRPLISLIQKFLGVQNSSISDVQTSLCSRAAAQPFFSSIRTPVCSFKRRHGSNSPLSATRSPIWPKILDF